MTAGASVPVWPPYRHSGLSEHDARPECPRNVPQSKERGTPSRQASKGVYPRFGGQSHVATMPRDSGYHEKAMTTREERILRQHLAEYPEQVTEGFSGMLCLVCGEYTSIRGGHAHSLKEEMDAEERWKAVER